MADDRAVNRHLLHVAPSRLVKLTARLAALYATVQMPVDVLMSVWLPEASYVGTKGASSFSSMRVYWLSSLAA